MPPLPFPSPHAGGHDPAGGDLVRNPLAKGGLVRGGLVMGGLGAATLDLVVASRCLMCRRPGLLCCPWCRRRLLDMAVDTPMGWAPVDVPVPVWGALPYRRPFSALVVAHKDHGALALTALLGQVLATAVRAAGEDHAPLTLVPVPSRAGATRRRGHDPTLAVARSAARLLRHSGQQVQTLPLVRSRGKVADQRGLSVTERRRNPVGSMSVRPARRGRITGNVVLVDDVVTTGATLREAVRAVHAAGLPVGLACVVAVTEAPQRPGR